MAAVATRSFLGPMQGNPEHQASPTKLTLADLLTLGHLAAVVGTPEGGPLTIDLGGRSKVLAPILPPTTGNVQPLIVIRRPGLTICNGCLKLPVGVCIQVDTGPDQAPVSLYNLTIRGPGAPGSDSALLSAVHGSQLLMTDCAVESGPEAAAQCSGIYVSGEGSRAELRQCTVSGCGGDGVHVAGAGASLIAEDCSSGSNSGSGWRASMGADLQLGPACIARANKLHGVIATDEDTRMTTGAGCRAENNQSAGWCCTRGAAMVTGERTMSSGNVQGFMVVVPGSVLTVGAHSVADSNAAAGYTSGQGGALVVGDHCAARHCGAGFSGSDRNARLDLGAHCAAEDNTNGIAAGPRAYINTGPGCSATGNKIHGVVVSGFDARVNLGEGFRMAGNGKNVFCGKRGFLNTPGLICEDEGTEAEAAKQAAAARASGGGGGRKGSDKKGDRSEGSAASSPKHKPGRAQVPGDTPGGGAGKAAKPLSRSSSKASSVGDSSRASSTDGTMGGAHESAGDWLDRASAGCGSKAKKGKQAKGVPPVPLPAAPGQLKKQPAGSSSKQQAAAPHSSGGSASSQGMGSWAGDAAAALLQPLSLSLAHSLPTAESLGSGFSSAPNSPRASDFGGHVLTQLASSAPTRSGISEPGGSKGASWSGIVGGASAGGSSSLGGGQQQQGSSVAVGSHWMTPPGGSGGGGGGHLSARHAGVHVHSHKPHHNHKRWGKK
uniref:Right handed beta helix domain-containing protein n=1 Tax=Chlamydomonas leiostraca TaxID=1034604 RepID=A0A7S0RHA5_9CHLO|mmetsp:Transcript_22961/g.58685  ORF Transcript_22961/g.58685 Transcript_22961/m.58685 type:complete len:719 (+) Transcript_22961:241-2397(+)|eukprot:CAMPEP_0202857034 /NCGR_PEP_ID=MMETSP1391-20130828/121_1 /ASSEMBLY_ACC=CAM_ASM_000867 /TAXON_ID=1034604 /ORGANISM="Chlamydomonas leiostraca, Strain SAG 11-49" /LENGTH=718 /DNA_ID=CAMNT_0049535781 /DNA_START=244 /DNA_END=2400 /DNA_ORIENTATION=+